MRSDADTIVAVASPLGAAPRAICRLSGPEALAIAGRLFVPLPAPGATYLAVPGEVRVRLRPRAGEPPAARVPATLLVMRAPRSYTREDVVELHLPGSPPVVAAVMAALVAAGARPAGPGEFTRRAFENGRIDLAQAEAVLAVIRAADDEALRSAAAALGSAALRRLRDIAATIDQLAALVELAIDFSEDDLEPVPRPELERRLAETVRDLESIAADPGGGAAADGAPIVTFLGLPNSGKSSLLNALVGRERCIVSPVPGTTRDVVTAPLTVGRWRMLLADTAGRPSVREKGVGDLDGSGPRPLFPADPEPCPSSGLSEPRCSSLSAAAWAAAERQAGASHLHLLVIDRSRPFSAEGQDVFDRLPGRAPAVAVLNKSDLPAAVSVEEVARWRPGTPVVETSALTGSGIEALRRTLAGAIAQGRVRLGAEGLLVSLRQARAAADALDALRRAQDLLAQTEKGSDPSSREKGVGDLGGSGPRPLFRGRFEPGPLFRPELVAFELRAARQYLDRITGRGLARAAEDVLDLVFSQFCIGK